MAYMRTRRGIGEYDPVSNWGWLFYPPPYSFADPMRLTPPPNFYAPAASMRLASTNGNRGMGCAGGCGCGGICGHGLGQIDWGFTSTDLAGKIGFPQIPNWIVYAAGVAVAGIARGSFGAGKGRRR